MITVSVWGVLGFIALGVLIAEAYEFHAWCKYQQGKREGREQHTRSGGISK